MTGAGASDQSFRNSGSPQRAGVGRRARTREDLIEEVRSLGERLGTSRISKLLFRRETGIGEGEVRKHFDTWNELVTAAGLTPTDMSRLPDEVLFVEMRDVFLAEGSVTTQLRFGKLARYDLTTYRRFGPWSRVLSAFHDWLIATGQDFPLIGELPAEPTAPLTTVETAPTSTSTVDALRGAGSGRRYGPFLSFRGLQHEPINEQGVVLLFGMVAHELGFVVESVHTGFPDCEAKRRVGRLWERSRIEFEFESRNFERHGHDPAGCDLIVCWRHNWPDAPLDVLELRAAIQGLDP